MGGLGSARGWRRTNGRGRSPRSTRRSRRTGTERVGGGAAGGRGCVREEGGGGGSEGVNSSASFTLRVAHRILACCMPTALLLACMPTGRSHRRVRQQSGWNGQRRMHASRRRLCVAIHSRALRCAAAALLLRCCVDEFKRVPGPRSHDVSAVWERRLPDSSPLALPPPATHAWRTFVRTRPGAKATRCRRLWRAVRIGCVRSI